MLRADREDVARINEETETRILAAIEDELEVADIMVISDYAKGVLTDRILAGAIAAAKASSKPVLVDPKGRDFNKYSGATLIKPNRGELTLATGERIDTDEDLVKAAGKLMQTVSVDGLLVTRAEHGMTLFSAGYAAPVTACESTRSV